MARSAIFASVVIQTVLKCGVSHIKSPVSIPVPASIANYFSPVKEILLIKQQKSLSFLSFCLYRTERKLKEKNWLNTKAFDSNKVPCSLASSFSLTVKAFRFLLWFSILISVNLIAEWTFSTQQWVPDKFHSYTLYYLTACAVIDIQWSASLIGWISN